MVIFSVLAQTVNKLVFPFLSLCYFSLPMASVCPRARIHGRVSNHTLRLESTAVAPPHPSATLLSRLPQDSHPSSTTESPCSRLSRHSAQTSAQQDSILTAPPPLTGHCDSESCTLHTGHPPPPPSPDFRPRMLGNPRCNIPNSLRVQRHQCRTS